VSHPGLAELRAALPKGWYAGVRPSDGFVVLFGPNSRAKAAVPTWAEAIKFCRRWRRAAAKAWRKQCRES